MSMYVASWLPCHHCHGVWVARQHPDFSLSLSPPTFFTQRHLMLNYQSRRRFLSSSTSPCQRDHRSVSCCRTLRRGGSWVSASIGAKTLILAINRWCTGSEPRWNAAHVGMVSTKECDELSGDVSMQRHLFFWPSLRKASLGRQDSVTVPYYGVEDQLTVLAPTCPAKFDDKTSNAEVF